MPYPYPRTPPVSGEYIGPDEQTTTYYRPPPRRPVDEVIAEVDPAIEAEYAARTRPPRPVDEVVAEVDPAIEAEYAASQAARRPQNSLASSVAFTPGAARSEGALGLESADRRRAAAESGWSEGQRGLESADRRRAAMSPPSAATADVADAGPAAAPSTGFSLSGLLSKYAPYATGLAATGMEAIPGIQTARDLASTGASAVRGALREAPAYATGLAATLAEKYAGKGTATAAPVTPPPASSKDTSTAPAVPPNKAADALTAPEPAKPREPIEDLRKRFNLVEYGPPKRPGQEDTAFGQRYRRIGGQTPTASYSNTGAPPASADGRGSYSQMEIKDLQGRDRYETLPHIKAARSDERIEDRRRGLEEAGLGAAIEDISPLPPGATTLPRRGIDIRRSQEEDIRRQRISKGLTSIAQDKAAKIQALRARPDYATMPEDQRYIEEDAIEQAATAAERALWGGEMLEDPRAAGQYLRGPR